MGHESFIDALAHGSDPTVTSFITRVAAPAAGADFTHVFGGAYIRRIIAISAQLVTSAAVANRQVRLDVSSSEGRVLSVPLVASVTASLTTQLSWAEGITPPNTALFDNCLVAGFPALVVPAGFSIASVTQGIDVADQYSNVLIWAETHEALPWTHYKEKLTAFRGEQIEGAIAALEG